MAGQFVLHVPRTAQRATLARARRVALAGSILAAVALLAGTAITFTVENAADTVTIGAGAAGIGVVTRGNALPGGAGAPTKWFASDANDTGRAPAWTPVLNAPVAVAISGDVALIDAREMGVANILVNFSLVNAAAMAASHGYFTLPVELRVWNASSEAWVDASTANGDGSPLVGGTPYATQFLSLANGFLTFTVDGSGVYEVAIPTGGSIYAVNTATLSPTFHVTTTPA